MKFKEQRPYADLGAAQKQLLELANAMEADHAGRLHVGPINRQFLDAGGSVAEYTAAVGPLSTAAISPCTRRAPI
jgi:hypothetical protein